MPVMKHESMIDPVDAQVGGDADIDGIAQTITADDIDTILTTPAPVAQRLDVLQSMRNELTARSHADRGHEVATLLNQIDAAIAVLSMRA